MRRRFIPLGLLVLTLPVASCGGGTKAASTVQTVTVTVAATSMPSGTPTPSSAAASSPQSSTLSPRRTATATHTAAPIVDPAFIGDGFVIPRLRSGWDWRNASYPSTCFTWDKPPISRHLRSGDAKLDEFFHLVLADSRRLRLNDGNTYEIVTLQCNPGAGQALSQVYAFSIRGSSLTYLGQPIRFGNRVLVRTGGVMDGEGVDIETYGWSKNAPDCCADLNSTFFISLSGTKVESVGRENEPLPQQ